jgi:hypothetical protein
VPTGTKAWRAGAGEAVLALGLLGVSGRAAAAEPARFSYSAPAGCPSEQDFVARVEERSLHERPAAGDELALSFVVTLSEDADGILGRVEFKDHDGTLVSRAVRGTTCDEVASSIALVTALAIDGRAEREAPEPLPSAPPPPPEPKRPAPPPSPARTTPPSPTERPSASALFTAGFGAGFQSVVGPTGGASLEAFLGVARGPGEASLRLTAWHWLGSGSQAGREGEFRAWGGRLDGCPVAFERAGVFVMPCAGAGAGLFRASGVEGPSLPRPKDASIAWFDATLFGRAGIVLGGLIVVEAEAALTLPLVRKRFGFSRPEPKATLYSVPALGAGAAAHAGVRFP